jgi:hypothetical protein
MIQRGHCPRFVPAPYFSACPRQLQPRRQLPPFRRQLASQQFVRPKSSASWVIRSCLRCSRRSWTAGRSVARRAAGSRASSPVVTCSASYPWSPTGRMPARSVYVACAAMSVVASFGLAFSDSFAPALFFRALTGLALAGMYMPGLRALTDGIDGPRRARVPALYTSSFTIGTAPLLSVRPRRRHLGLACRLSCCGACQRRGARTRLVDASAIGDQAEARESLLPVARGNAKHKVVLTKREIQADQLPARLFAKVQRLMLSPLPGPRLTLVQLHPRHSMPRYHNAHKSLTQKVVAGGQRPLWVR